MLQETLRLPPSYRDWWQVLRPKTLTASLIPFLSGACLAYAEGASIRIFLLVCAIASAILIQIGTNLINDAADFVRGADDFARLGPKRAIQQGMASKDQIYMGGVFAFLLSLICAIPLIMHGGAPLFALLLVSLVAGYCYTAGPFPLAYAGLGELFVLVFFGWVATGAGVWIHTDTLGLAAFVLGTQIGLLCTVLIAINNLRDIAGDTRVGKKTLAVRFGKSFARVEIALSLIIPYLLSMFWIIRGMPYAALLPLIPSFIAVLLIKKTLNEEPSTAYNRYLGLAALLHLLFGVLIGMGLLLA